MPYYDVDGREITEDEWKRLSDDRVYLRVGATELRSDGPPQTVIRVSTVWTGVDTGGWEIFESLVDKDGRKAMVVKYHTRDAAKEGHNALVGKFMSELPPGAREAREIPAEET
ncbi:hypothetical protein ACFYP4_02465 [Streptomyces sp. NPDC005551]|uniref:hypothetical protein n=1 Tax=Streptomyces sp. NPDC005551 TaxID=3364725 RepID=UPI0036C80790